MRPSPAPEAELPRLRAPARCLCAEPQARPHTPPDLRARETIWPVKGDLFLYVLIGTVDWSQYGSASRKSCFLLKTFLTALSRPI